MTEDFERLIEEISDANTDALEEVIEIFEMQDPVARFQALEMWKAPEYRKLLRRARAITIDEIQRSPGSPSLRTIGTLLGISGQRVHQLAKMAPRRTPDGRPTGDTSPTAL
jgi:hypothetical protein